MGQKEDESMDKNTNAQDTTETAVKGVQVSAMLTPAEIAKLEDYRFNKQIATRKDVKRSDVVREALTEFLSDK